MGVGGFPLGASPQEGGGREGNGEGEEEREGR